jgi:hypothetical protein
MAQISIRIDLEAEDDRALKAWAEGESRSKREQAGVLLRKLLELRRTQPAELERLGLSDRLLSQPAGDKGKSKK